MLTVFVYFMSSIYLYILQTARAKWMEIGFDAQRKPPPASQRKLVKKIYSRTRIEALNNWNLIANYKTKNIQLLPTIANKALSKSPVVSL